MSSKHDIKRNACQLFGRQAKCGYDWWWHSFTAQNAVTGEDQPFYIEFFLCNPKQGGHKPIFGDIEKGIKPSYLMVNVGAWGKKKCQLHRFFGWKNIKVNMGVPFSVEADDCYITEKGTPIFTFIFFLSRSRRTTAILPKRRRGAVSTFQRKTRRLTPNG